MRKVPLWWCFAGAVVAATLGCGADAESSGGTPGVGGVGTGGEGGSGAIGGEGGTVGAARSVFEASNEAAKAYFAALCECPAENSVNSDQTLCLSSTFGLTVRQSLCWEDLELLEGENVQPFYQCNTELENSAAACLSDVEGCDSVELDFCKNKRLQDFDDCPLLPGYLLDHMVTCGVALVRDVLEEYANAASAKCACSTEVDCEDTSIPDDGQRACLAQAVSSKSYDDLQRRCLMTQWRVLASCYAQRSTCGPGDTCEFWLIAPGCDVFEGFHDLLDGCGLSF